MKTRISVLIVEQSQTFSMYLSLLLQRMGLKALRVSKADAAVTVLARGFTDVLIVGDQAGPEPIHAIVRKLAGHIVEENIPIIVISKQEDPAERKACYDAGCQSYLLKPVQPKQLLAALYSKVTPESERRQNLRCTVDIMAEIAFDQQAPSSFRVFSLSKGGALIRSSKTVPVDTKVSVKLCLDDQCFSLGGEVIYNQANADGQGSRAIGIIFNNVLQTDAELIDQYLEQRLLQE